MHKNTFNNYINESTEKSIMKKFEIFVGLGGGFGGAQSQCIHEYASKKEAEEDARVMACEEYESYEGLHGLQTVDEIQEENDCDYEEAQRLYEEERESWLDYHVVEIKD